MTLRTVNGTGVAAAIPRRAAHAIVLLLFLEGVALWWTPLEPVPGPLLLCTQIAVVHLALLMPAAGTIAPAWNAYASAVALSVVWMAGYGHAAGELAGCAALVASAGACGAAAQRLTHRRFYLASITMLLALPIGCAYLVEEFGSLGAAAGWRALSPLSGTSAAAILVLWAWPVAVLARRRRA